MNWANFIAKQKVRLSRGRDYFFYAQSLLTLNTFLKVFGVEDFAFYAVLNVGAVFLLWFTGYADDKWFGIWSAENRYLTEDLNPTFKEIVERNRK